MEEAARDQQQPSHSLLEALLFNLLCQKALFILSWDLGEERDVARVTWRVPVSHRVACAIVGIRINVCVQPG